MNAQVPMHRGSWLNMAEIELSVLSGQSLDRRTDPNWIKSGSVKGSRGVSMHLAYSLCEHPAYGLSDKFHGILLNGITTELDCHVSEALTIIRAMAAPMA